MVECHEIVSLVKQTLPDAHVEVEDMTGGSDHFQIFVVSSRFQGMSLIDQHRLVQKSIQAMLHDGRIHAVRIKTETPERWSKERPDGDLHVME